MNEPNPQSDLHHARNLATVVYALQAAGLVVGLTYFLAALLNWLKADIANGTWVASHFRWQINTFWYSLIWGVLGGLTLLWGVGYFILIGDALWVTYRIVQGWSRLNRGRAMPATQPLLRR